MKTNKAGHWPRFSSPLPKEVTDRFLMGYAPHFVEHPISRQVQGALIDMLALPVSQLLSIISQVEQPLATRIAAGEVLGLKGDPRIDPFNPHMLTVPGGTVQIGLAPERVDPVMSAFEGLGLDRSWIEKETPCHRVALDEYRIARYPVTNSEYRHFLLETQHPALASSWAFGAYPHHMANHPVYSVDASDADAYACWLSKRTGRLFALPSEAQWEHAAAGSQRLQFPWGEHFDATFANTAELGLMQTTPVGVFIEGASPFGVMDMAGNVEEYVAQAYHPYPGGPQIRDDLELDVGEHRVARGGSFTRFRDLARTARRHGRYPRPLYVMGFRLVENLR